MDLVLLLFPLRTGDRMGRKERAYYGHTNLLRHRGHTNFCGRDPGRSTPIKGAVQVAPGWHQVSYFPPNMNINTGSMSQNRKMRDLIQIARQDVLVEEGKTVRVVLSYRSLEGEALEYEQRLSSSRWVGLSMVFVLFGLMTWAM